MADHRSRFNPSSGFDRIRVRGLGVVGSNTYINIAAFAAAAIAVWALQAQPIFALAAVAMVLLAAWLGTHKNEKFADKHPELAALGGTEYLRMRQLQMAGKDMPVVSPSESTNPAPIIDVAGSK